MGDHEGRGCDFGNHVSNCPDVQGPDSSYSKSSFTEGGFLLHMQKDLSRFDGKVLPTPFILLFEDLIGRKACFSTVQRYLCTEL